MTSTDQQFTINLIGAHIFVTLVVEGPVPSHMWHILNTGPAICCREGLGKASGAPLLCFLAWFLDPDSTEIHSGLLS